MKRVLTVAIFLMVMVWQVPVLAAGLSEITENMVLETGTDADLYEEASDRSRLVVSLDAGTVVFTVEAAADNWCKISAGEHTGYVRVENLKTIDDQELIRQEIEQNINHDYVDDEERQQTAEQGIQTGLWGKALPALVIVMLTAGGVYVKMRTGRETQE